jgi:hypothetical protein
MVQMRRFPPPPWFPDEDEAVAGAGSSGDEEGLLRAEEVPRAGLDSEKLELWNSRSSWRSVWPRSPCLVLFVREVGGGTWGGLEGDGMGD